MRSLSSRLLEDTGEALFTTKLSLLLRLRRSRWPQQCMQALKVQPTWCRRDSHLQITLALDSELMHKPDMGLDQLGQYSVETKVGREAFVSENKLSRPLSHVSAYNSGSGMRH